MSEHNEEYTVDDPRLTAFALGELEGGEAQAMEAFLAKSPEARAAVEEIRACTGMLELELAEEGGAELSSAQRDAIDAELEPRVLVPRKRSRVLRVGVWVAAAAAVGAFVWVFLPEALSEKSEPFTYRIWGDEGSGGDVEMGARIESPLSETWSSDPLAGLGYSGGRGLSEFPASGGVSATGRDGFYLGHGELQALGYTGAREPGIVNAPVAPESIYFGFEGDMSGLEGIDISAFLNEGEDAGLRERVARLYSYSEGKYAHYTWRDRTVLHIKQGGTVLGKRELLHDPDHADNYEKLARYLNKAIGEMESEAQKAERLRAPFTSVITVPDRETWSRITSMRGTRLADPLDDPKLDNAQVRNSVAEIARALESIRKANPEFDSSSPFDLELFRGVIEVHDTPTNAESYAKIVDNPFVPVRDDSLSTFSIDVDTASYANTRRHLLASGTLPPPDAVRIEELINYFPYDYPSPDASQPFSVNVEIASAPWKPEHRLVKIGLKGREPVYSERKNANLVFLIDVSGSMNGPTKLPLLVESLSMLVANLDSSDRVAIVVYAGSSGLVLDSTSCSQKPLIISALERLSAGGSTNGGQGIRLAYAVAQQNFVDGGINRVVLATDGDFNVGTTSQAALQELITEKAKDGVFLSVLGFGSGNLKDSTMEMLADKGNGNYSYIDTKMEGHKVLVEQLGGTLVAIAKDVKIQIEFNPAEVQAFRLIGYENRVLAHQDFNDDTKDAGEIGSGHTVTALYEVVPHGVEFSFFNVDPLRYQADAENGQVPTEAANSGELLTLKLRYKQPEGSVSRKIVYAVHDEGTGIDKASEDFRFAASVASFGMLLRGSRYKGAANWDDTLRLAQEGQGADVGGYRLEFTYLVQRAAGLSR